MNTTDETRVPLKPRQIEYLKRMADAHELPDWGKALRCLVDHAIERADLESEIYDEIRCRDC